MWETVSTFIDKYDLLPNHSTVVVGVSGGADSMGLLHYLDSIKDAKSLKLVVAHVDHMFRGKESEGDMRFVQKQCEVRNLAFEAEQIDVAAYQMEKKLSPQVAARECRYEFYERVMDKHNARVLALGHHADDQVETILMRLGRGSSMAGYAVMSQRTSMASQPAAKQPGSQRAKATSSVRTRRTAHAGGGTAVKAAPRKTSSGGWMETAVLLSVILVAYFFYLYGQIM
jgi:tRNA(Ile)-lysidine synthetase-like protein